MERSTICNGRKMFGCDRIFIRLGVRDQRPCVPLDTAEGPSPFFFFTSQNTAAILHEIKVFGPGYRAPGTSCVSLSVCVTGWSWQLIH
jgi:hypothetical protein